MDNVKPHKIFSTGAIWPNFMNLSDEGKNRRAMDDIDLLGCQSVLEKLGRWHGQRLPEARQELFHWDRVVNQKTVLEKMCYDAGVLLIYNAKYCPEWQPIEKVWLESKMPLHEEQYMEMAAVKKAWRDRLNDPSLDKQAEKWFKLSR